MFRVFLESGSYFDVCLCLDSDYISVMDYSYFALGKENVKQLVNAMVEKIKE